MLLDCANGATYRAAPLLFQRLGAEVECIGAEPDGVNINAGCGSTHPELTAERMRAGGHDVGFAFDGDGDRVLALAADGSVVDGDEIIAAIGQDLKRRGELQGGGVAVTVMTNFGFHQTMGDAGIEVATTDVGDRHVVEELFQRDWVLGGEQSGHIVDMRLTPSGDGIAAALLLLRALGDKPLVAGEAMRKAAPGAGERTRRGPRCPGDGDRRVGGRRVGVEHARRGGPHPGAPVRNRAGRARDGRGADPGALRNRGRTRRRGRRARAGRCR